MTENQQFYMFWGQFRTFGTKNFPFQVKSPGKQTKETTIVEKLYKKNISCLIVSKKSF